jgi:hypothetical protein
MSNLPAALGTDYQLIDFERRLQGSDGVNIINSRYVDKPLPGWTARHEISTERRTLEGVLVPTTRVVVHFYAAGNSRATIVITCVNGLMDPEWELYARYVGADAVASTSHARSLANRLLDALLRETEVRIGP